MWTFHPKVGFFSAVIDRQKPGNTLVRFRDPIHGNAFIAAAWEGKRGRRPELVVTPPPADYRWKVSITNERFVSTVTALADAVDYDNFKSACHRSEVWRRADSRLMPVWSTMNALQQAIVDEERREKRYGTVRPPAGETWLIPEMEDREGEGGRIPSDEPL